LHWRLPHPAGGNHLLLPLTVSKVTLLQHRLMQLNGMPVLQRTGLQQQAAEMQLLAAATPLLVVLLLFLLWLVHRRPRRAAAGREKGKQQQQGNVLLLLLQGVLKVCQSCQPAVACRLKPATHVSVMQQLPAALMARPAAAAAAVAVAAAAAMAVVGMQSVQQAATAMMTHLPAAM
jgi:hypothetical protein